MEMPALLFTGVADPVIRPEAQVGFEANAPRDASSWWSRTRATGCPRRRPEALLAAMLELYAS